MKSALLLISILMLVISLTGNLLTGRSIDSILGKKPINDNWMLQNTLEIYGGLRMYNTFCNTISLICLYVYYFLSNHP